MSKNHVPYAKLKKWKRIVDVQLILLLITAAIAIIMCFVTSASMDVIRDIVVGITTGIIISAGVPIFVYFKFLKHIPDETRKQINDLLNSRREYETTNHNAVMNALNPNNAHLSYEHTAMKNIIGREYSNIKSEIKSATNLSLSIKEHVEKTDYEKKLQYSNLHIGQKEIIDSIEKIYSVVNALQLANSENLTLTKKINDEIVENQIINRDYCDLENKYNGLLGKYNQIIEAQHHYERHDHQRNGLGIDSDR